MSDDAAVMEAGGAPAATPEPGAEASLPEHGSPPAADLFPFTSAAPAVVVVTVDAPAGAEAEAAAPGGKPPIVFSPSKGKATFVPKQVEVSARCVAAPQLRHGSGAAAARLLHLRLRGVAAARRHSEGLCADSGAACARGRRTSRTSTGAMRRPT